MLPGENRAARPRNYGIILAGNGMSGGPIGTPDARWNDSDLQCLTSLTLSDFEPINVSSLTAAPPATRQSTSNVGPPLPRTNPQVKATKKFLGLPPVNLDTIASLMPFISQPFSAHRLGDYILKNLGDPRWTTFRAAVAFVKRSGTQYIRQPLAQFSATKAVKVSVGIDLGGTSVEGLEDLLAATPNGEVWVYHNANNSTFHPKIYLFRSQTEGELLVGSGNLTTGGLFKNYEGSLALSLNLNSHADSELLASVETVLDSWSQQFPGLCYRLTPEFLEQLRDQGFVRSEAEMAASVIKLQAPLNVAPGNPNAPAAQGAPAAHGGQAGPAPLFISQPVPPAPVLIAAEEAAAPEGAPAANVGPQVAPEEPPQGGSSSIPVPAPMPSAGAGVSSFVMTLQTTDVGTGQTTPGTAARSPEVFIPLVALDTDQAFWNFPQSFTADAVWNAANPQYRRNGLGKLDWHNVPIRIGVVHMVSMFFNPRKKDFRLRHEAIRSAGNVGDILWVQKVNPVNGFEYDVQVAPQGTPLFNQLNSYCNTQVVNSQKRFGYF